MASRVVIVVPPGGMDSMLRVLESHLLEWNGNGPTAEDGTPFTVDGEGKDDGDDCPSVSDSECSQGQLANVPFEMHAYEAVLTTATALHAHEFGLINAEAQRVLLHFHAKSGGSILPFSVQVRYGLLCVMSQPAWKGSAVPRRPGTL